MEKATFGAGCFWSVEAAFRKLKGVLSTTVGFSGGTTRSPSYQEVCSDRTGHAEVVQVEYNPYIITYEQMLNLFWEIHDPTQVNRQGPDVGSQYRSVIFYHTPDQMAAAIVSKEKAQTKHKKPVVTEILPAVAFYPAEDYHQQYLEKRGLSSCHL
ncbi:MAG: peptide-methionine (S)-S-oxide reductase MsrA [Verrucomicrobia subdivision 3 bacterium]|nr:peptide-methionine (S)-S-oxide reductase MsrA [Limisphaerales bacterium]